MSKNGTRTAGNNLIVIAVFFAAISMFFWGSLAGITDVEILEQRELAESPKLESLSDAILYAKNFEAYFSDHFLVRNRLINVDRWMRVNLFDQRYFEEVAITDEGWLFYNQPIMSDDCQRTAVFTQRELRRMQSAMLKAVDVAEENGIELHYLIAPNKCTIYSEYSEGVFPVLGEITRADQVREHLAGQTQISLIDLRDTMQGFKDGDLIYYPDDTHWNELGIFLIHAEIIETLLPELPLEDYLAAEDFSRRTVSRVGDLSLLLGLDQFQSISTNWFPVDEWLIIEEPADGIVVVENPGARTDQTILISHDSFFQPDLIRALFSAYFEKVVFLHDNRGFQWDSNPEVIQSWIDEWQPDVILVEKTERNIHNFALDTSGK